MKRVIQCCLYAVRVFVYIGLYVQVTDKIVFVKGKRYIKKDKIDLPIALG